MQAHDSLLPAAPTRMSTRIAVGGFLLDLLIAVSVLFAASLAGGAVWAASEVFLSVRTGASLGEPAQLFSRIGEPSGLALLLITLVATSTAALAVYFGRHRAQAAERAASRRAAAKPSTWGWALLVGFATLCFGLLLGVLGQLSDADIKPSNLALIEDVQQDYPWLLLVFAVVLAPMYEELLFRRVLFGRLLAAGRPWLGLMLSSAAFALMHEIPGTTDHGWVAAALLWLTYGAMGAAFAWVYRRTGTLWASIGAHATNNLVACGLLFAGAQ